MAAYTGDTLAISVLLWGAAVTPTVQAVEEARKRNTTWAIGYGAASLLLLSAGCVWPALVSLIQNPPELEIGQLFQLGTLLIALIFATVGKIRDRTKAFLPMLMDGMPIVPYIVLLIFPIYPDLARDLIVSGGTVFALAGISGLFLLIPKATQDWWHLGPRI